MPYNPPTRVQSLSVPWLALVLRADPDFQREKRREVEYEFSSGRVMRADRSTRGAYAED
jgi:hypothetical protein